jgi:hypothetical protein
MNIFMSAEVSVRMDERMKEGQRQVKGIAREKQED